MTSPWLWIYCEIIMVYSESKNELLVTNRLCLLKDDQVVSDDGDGGTTWRLQLPPTAGASGGQRCWTCWADRCIPHNCKVCSYSYIPEGCHVNYNPCHFCPVLLLPNVAEKQFFFFLTSRLGGEEARQFLPAVEQHFSRLGKVTLVSFYLFWLI